jgi:hypothetical protein
VATTCPEGHAHAVSTHVAAPTIPRQPFTGPQQPGFSLARQEDEPLSASVEEPPSLLLGAATMPHAMSGAKKRNLTRTGCQHTGPHC